MLVISHNLADVFEVADRIFVLRLGRKAGDFAVGDASQQEVVAAITGAEFAAHADQKGDDNERARRRRRSRHGRRRGRSPRSPATTSCGASSRATSPSCGSSWSSP